MKTQWEHSALMWKHLRTITTLASREMCLVGTFWLVFKDPQAHISSTFRAESSVKCSEKVLLGMYLHLSDKYLNFPTSNHIINIYLSF